jgi:hypothetical protein
MYGSMENENQGSLVDKRSGRQTSTEMGLGEVEKARVSLFKHYLYFRKASLNRAIRSHDQKLSASFRTTHLARRVFDKWHAKLSSVQVRLSTHFCLHPRTHPIAVP